MSKTATTLQEFIQNPAGFNEVKLSHQNLTNDDCTKLAAALKGNSTVTHLQLYGNQLGDKGATILAEGLKGNTSVISLWICNDQVGDQGAAALAEGLKGNNTLRHLYLQGNLIGDQGATYLIECLKVNKTIIYCLLADNQIGDQGAAYLADFFKNNKTHSYLYLQGNLIGDQGAIALAECLKGNNTVTHLGLSNNRIGDQGAIALAECLKGNNTVTYVELSHNQIGDKSAVATAKMLKDNKAITHLSLNNNQIGDIGLLLLKVSWQGNIVNLNLSSQNPTVEAKVSKEAQQKAEQEAAENVLLKAKLQEAEEKLAAIVKAKQAKQEAKAAQIEAERLALEAKLKEAEEAKAVKEAAKLKALAEEKVKEYVPEADLNITKIFAEEAPIEGGLADHNQTIRQVSELIRDGNDRLQEHTKKGILLLGDTGAGKSTLAHLLSGRKLQAIVDDKLGKLIVDAMQPLADIVIGHIPASETKIPNKCLADGTVIWDCPGFNDTKPVQEIANIFYTKKLFEITDEMKFVLVVPESDLSKKKGNNFLETLSSFMKVFSNIEATSGSVSLVITQVPSYKKLQHIKNTIEDILIHNESVTMEQRILVNKLVNNSSLHLFHKPNGEGEFEAINPLEAIESSTWYTKSSPNMANMSISAKALECSLPLLGTAGSNFNKILEITTKAILAATDCLKANQNNLLAQNYHIIKDMVPMSIYHKNLALHPENEHFSELDLLFRLQKILGAGQAGSMIDGLNVLWQALETIAEYAESGNIVLKNQIQDYAYCLKQQYEYVKFFAGVCDKELPAAHLNGLLQLCGAKVAENLEFQVSTLHIDQSKLDADYYHKAISYLENYPASKPCVKLKALCYSSLATNIFEHKNDSDSAIGYYIKAVKTNNQLPEVYEKLGQLFFNKGQYAKAIEAYKVVNNEFEIKACFKEWLKQSPKNPDIMLKQAEYFESIGLFESAKKSYHHAFSLSKNETVKANALEKIGNIMANAAVLGQSFTQKAQDHDFFNFDSVTPEFIHNLLGDAAIFDNFHA